VDPNSRRIFYFDINGSDQYEIGSDWKITIHNVNFVRGFLLIRSNAFPDESTGQYRALSEFTSWIITAFDRVASQRYYFTVVCDEFDPCEFNIIITKSSDSNNTTSSSTTTPISPTTTTTSISPTTCSPPLPSTTSNNISFKSDDHVDNRLTVPIIGIIVAVILTVTVLIFGISYIIFKVKERRANNNNTAIEMGTMSNSN